MSKGRLPVVLCEQLIHLSKTPSQQRIAGENSQLRKAPCSASLQESNVCVFRKQALSEPIFSLLQDPNRAAPHHRPPPREPYHDRGPPRGPRRPEVNDLFTFSFLHERLPSTSLYLESCVLGGCNVVASLSWLVKLCRLARASLAHWPHDCGSKFGFVLPDLPYLLCHPFSKACSVACLAGDSIVPIDLSTMTRS
jgi:hypothetical protein